MSETDAALKNELHAVELPLVAALREGAHDVRRQVRCGNFRLDIVDDTTGEIIECKARGNAASICAAVGQLRRYRHHIFDPQLAIAVPLVEPEAQWLAEMLKREGIRIIEVSKGAIGI